MIKKISLLSSIAFVLLFAGCDNSSSSSSGGGSGAASVQTMDSTGLRGRWIAAYKAGRVDERNKVMELSGDGTYKRSTTPPLSESEFFDKDSGTWVARNDTLFLQPVFSQSSSDGGVTWKNRALNLVAFPYRFQEQTLILVTKNFDTGADEFKYWIKG